MNGHHEGVARSSRPRQHGKTTTAYAPAWFERHFAILLKPPQICCDVTETKLHFLGLYHLARHCIHKLHQAHGVPRKTRILHWYRSVSAICEHCTLRIYEAPFCTSLRGVIFFHWKGKSPLGLRGDCSCIL